MANVLRSHAAAVVAAGQQKALGDPDSLPSLFPAWEDFGLGDIELSRRIVPIISAIWEDSGKAFAPKVGLDPDSFYARSPEIRDAVDKASLELAESTNASTTMDLSAALAEVRAAVLEKTTGHDVSISDLATRINEVFSLATRSRARMIGVTEAARAVHSAQEMAAEKSGTVTGWRWLLSEDACPLCQTIARRAEYVQLGKPFAVIGDHPSYSEIRHPPAHPHCQCSMTEVLIIDRQPEWAATLIQPKPEAEDYPPGEAPDSTPASVTEMPKPDPPVIVAPPRPKPSPPKLSKVVSAPKPTPKPLVPAGTPVSAGLQVEIKDAGIRAKYQAVIEAIDKVHGDGRLPGIPIESTTKGSNQGEMLVGALTGRPMRIKIHKMASEPTNTIAHEIGHYLDWSGIPGGGGTKGRGFEGDPRFAEWHKAVSESDAIRKLKAMKGTTRTQGKISFKADDKFIGYMSDPKEIWARAYAQYIAVKSESPEMLADLDKIRKSAVYHDQWSDEDFAPIMKAMDGIFKGMGWVK